MTDVETTGTDLIRQAIFARSRKANLAPLARDLGIAVNALEEFCRGRAELSAEVKRKLVAFHWNGSAEFDAEQDALRPAHREPARSMGLRPTWSAPLYKPTATVRPAPQPVVKPKSTGKTRRAGWVE